MQHTHLGVYALITTADTILVIRKLRGPYTGTCDLPGGTPEHGETHLETAQREVREETGLSLVAEEFSFLAATSLVHAYHVNGVSASLHHHAIVYTAQVPPGKARLAEINDLDSGGAVWMSRRAAELSPLAQHVLTLAPR